MNDKYNDKLIEDFGKFISVAINDSMYPIIESGIHSVKLVKINNDTLLKKRDIVLYEGNDENVDLKRIIRIRKNNLYLCGDNETKIIKVERSKVLAICIGILNNNTLEYIDVTNEEYNKYSKHIIHNRIIRIIKNVFNRKNKRKIG